MRDAPRERASICFVAPAAYSLFNKNTNYKIGGSEVRTYLLSTGLATYPEYDVSCVVMDYGQPQVEEIEGVKVYAHPGHRHHSKYVRRRRDSWLTQRLSAYYVEVAPYIERTEHFPYRRLTTWRLGLWLKAVLVFTLHLRLWPRLKALSNRLRDWIRRRTSMSVGEKLITRQQIAIYEQIDADSYCVINIHDVAAEVAAFCKRYGKSFILIGGHDRNFSKVYLPSESTQDEYGTASTIGYYVINAADHIVAQTPHQAEMLRDNYGREATVIPNPFDFDTMVENVPPYPERTSILWVGRPPDVLKRPEVFLRLARAFPQLSFTMVYRVDTNASSQGLYGAVDDQKPDNVTLFELIPFHEIDTLFARASVLVNTSTAEGFPNTFLHAGKYGVPILSMCVDPEQMLNEHGCGVVADDDFTALKQGLETLLADQAGGQSYSRNIYRYVREMHDMKQIIPLFDEMLQGLIRKAR